MRRHATRKYPGERVHPRPAALQQQRVDREHRVATPADRKHEPISHTNLAARSPNWLVVAEQRLLISEEPDA
jgi:hypothetical protein